MYRRFWVTIEMYQAPFSKNDFVHTFNFQGNHGYLTKFLKDNSWLTQYGFAKSIKLYGDINNKIEVLDCASNYYDHHKETDKCTWSPSNPIRKTLKLKHT